MRSILRGQGQPPLLHRQRKKIDQTEQRVEHDFWTNPTVSSRLILHGKFAAASKRLRAHPEEANIWLVSSRKERCHTDVTSDFPIDTVEESSIAKATQGSTEKLLSEQKPKESSKIDKNEFSMNQLPLHMACSQLSRWRSKDSSNYRDLQELIQLLCVLSSKGARERDHSNRLPLHEAIWYQAQPDTISALLLAYPLGLTEPDVYGRNPLDLWDYAQVKENVPYYQQVRDLLTKSVTFWQKSRAEAELRLQMNRFSEAGSVVSVADSHTSYRRGRAPPGYQVPEQSTPIEWSQLEHRMLLVEAQLATALELNYHQEKKLRAVDAKNKELVKQNDKIQQLEKENRELCTQVLHLQKSAGATPNTSCTSVNNEEVELEACTLQSGLPRAIHFENREDEEKERLLEENLRLEQDLEALQDHHAHYQRRLERLEIMLKKQQTSAPVSGDSSCATSSSNSIEPKISPRSPTSALEVFPRCFVSSPKSGQTHLSPDSTIEVQNLSSTWVHRGSSVMSPSRPMIKELIPECNESGVDFSVLLRETVELYQGSTSTTDSTLCDDVRMEYHCGGISEGLQESDYSWDTVLEEAVTLYGGRSVPPTNQ